MSELQRRDLLGGSIDKGTPFFATLVGVRQALTQFFGIEELPIIHNNEVKMIQRNKQNPEYPYAYLGLTNIALSEDKQNAKTIRRHGLTRAVNGTNSTVDKYYFFPITIGLEMHFVSDDFQKASKFILKALLLLGTEALNFQLRVSDMTDFWKVRISMPTKDLQLPRADKENELDPETHDIVLNFVVETWHGVIRETAKINNDGHIQLNAMVVESDGSISDADEGEESI